MDDGTLRPSSLLRAPHGTLSDYFETAIGSGFLATSHPDGSVNIAVYDRPRIVDDGIVAFAMTPRKTHANLLGNRHAVYAFHESGKQGIRLFLEKIREEADGPLLEKLRTHIERVQSAELAAELEYVVYFRVVQTLPLVV